jgi:salicylate hydroxylase
VWCLYRSLGRTHDPKAPPNTVPYHIPYSLHLYNESRVHFLHRVERQIQMDKLDNKYIMGAGDDYQEWVRRYNERFTINWWLLEHDAEAEWQRVESEERFRRDELGLNGVGQKMANVDLGATEGLAPHLGAF